MAKIARMRVYNIPILSKALDVLEMLQAERHPMSLESVYQRSGFSKSTVFRILKTLVLRGYVARQEDGLYRAVSRPRKMRFGYGVESGQLLFCQAVTASLSVAASASGIDLLVLDNCYDGEVALKNAETFVEEQVDLVIEAQVDQRVAPIISDKIFAAGIPLIAVDIPHPHATFLGVDNFRVGFEAGELLGRHACLMWEGVVNWVVGLEIEQAGPLVRSRITGAFEGIRSVLPGLPKERFVLMGGEDVEEKCFRLIHEFLQTHPEEGILIAAAGDDGALGAVRAARALKRDGHVAIVGQDCIPQATREMKTPGSPLIGSVSHEAQEYGPRLIELGIALVEGKHVRPYNYIEHKLVTAESLIQS